MMLLMVLTADAETARSTRRSEISEVLIAKVFQADLTNYQTGDNLYKFGFVPSPNLLYWFIDIIHGTYV